MRKIALFFACLLAFFAVPANSTELTVSAAASLSNAFDEISKVFGKEHPGLQIHSNYAASNPLLRQIVAGAPADIFASADEDTMNKAVEAKVIDTATRKDFAKNALVVIVPKGAKKPANLADLEKMDRIAIGNPDSVPAGRYTRAALTQAGLWEKLQPNYILGESVRQALDYVARGEADAGFVYATDAHQLDGKVEIAMIAEGHDPVTYPIAVVTASSNARMAKEFIDFVLSPQGQAILAKYGFTKP